METESCQKKSCSITLPLNAEKWQTDRLDIVFLASDRLHNRLVEKVNNLIADIKRNKKWSLYKDQLTALSKEYKKLKIPQKESDRTADQQTAADKYAADKAVVYAKKNALIQQYGLDKNSIEKRANELRRCVDNILPSMVVQMIADEVEQGVSACLYGNGKSVSYASVADYRSIEGKTNKACVRYKDGCVFYGGKGRFSLQIPVKICSEEGTSSYIYERDMLKHTIKRCRIIRRPTKTGWSYFVQLVLDGEPEVKVNPETGEVLRPLGKGRVGIDIGPQTVATDSSTRCRLEELAPGADPLWHEIKLLRRAIDRSVKANNRDFFTPDGQVIPKNKLDKSLLNRYGKRRWKKTKSCRRMENRLRYLLNHMAVVRKEQHHRMVNQIIADGDVFRPEKMNWAALAKRAKPQQNEKKTTETKSTCKERQPTAKRRRRKKSKKCKSTKRFGRSICKKAPAAFLDILNYKVTISGGVYQPVNTVTVKASQYDHISDTYTKHELKERFVVKGDKTIQRDLSAAFNLRNTTDNLKTVDRDRCLKDFNGFLFRHDAEVRRIRQINNRRPSSMGI